MIIQWSKEALESLIIAYQSKGEDLPIPKVASYA